MVIITGDIAFPGGGAPLKRVMHVAEILAGQGMNVILLPGSGVGSRFKLAPLDTRCGGRLTIVGWTRLAGDRPSLGKLAWFIRTYWSTVAVAAWMAQRQAYMKEGVVYLYGRSFLRLAPLMYLARKMGALVVVDATEGVERFHGSGGRLNPVYWDWWVGSKFLFKNADIVAAISVGLADRARAAGARRVVLLPAMDEWPEVPLALGHARERTFSIVVFGGLTEKDDPALLAAVVEACGRKGMVVKWNLVGRFSQNRQSLRWAKLIHAKAIAGVEVILSDDVGSDILSGILSGAHAFVALRADTTAERLAFPTRLVELLKHGRPIITSAVGDTERYLRNEIDALVVQPRDVSAVVDGLEKLLGMSDRGFALGMRGFERGKLIFERTRAMQPLLDELHYRRSHGERESFHRVV